MNPLRLCNWLVLAVLAAAGPTAHACPRNADPSLRGPAVGQDLVVNGLPVQIQSVSSPDPVQAVMDRVERAWKEAGHEVRRRQLGPWTIVSALSDQCLSTLQLMPRGGAVGLFAIGNPARARTTAVQRGIGLPPGAEVVSTVSARDGARTGVTTTLLLRGTVTEAALFFKHRLEVDGWTAVRTLGLQAPNSLQRSATVSGQRSGEVVQIAIVPSRLGAMAVVNRADTL